MKRFLDSKGLKYDVDEDDLVIRYGLKLDCKLGGYNVRCYIEEEYVKYLAVIRMNASEDTRKKVAEFITRANYGLKFGRFDMDMSDGEIMYRIDVHVPNFTMNEQLADNLVGFTDAMLERYGDGLLMVMMGFAEPEEAIKKVEG